MSRCYFCNEKSTMKRRDMDVQVCDEHRRQERDTQPSLPLPHVESAAKAIGLTAVPKKSIAANLCYNASGDRAVFNDYEKSYVEVPSSHYYWLSHNEKAIHWERTRERAEERMRQEGFI